MVSPMIRYRLPSIARRSVIVDRYPQRPSTGPKPGKQSRRIHSASTPPLAWGPTPAPRLATWPDVRPSSQVANVVAFGAKPTSGRGARNDANDPKRRFATVNCRTAKGSFAFDFGCPTPTLIAGRAGARLDHSRPGAAARPPVPEATRGHSHCAKLSRYDALS